MPGAARPRGHSSNHSKLTGRDSVEALHERYAESFDIERELGQRRVAGV
jgi:hypothetical protein